jgi:hypothetical protein
MKSPHNPPSNVKIDFFIYKFFHHLLSPIEDHAKIQILILMHDILRL